MLKFIKMHGLGNDFVIIDTRPTRSKTDEWQGYAGLALPDLARRMSDRRFGVGCDQFIVLEPSATADVFMRIMNPDGSEAGACGNATRCVADLILREKGGVDHLVVETVSGHLPARRADGGRIMVDMGAPRLMWDEIPLASHMDTLVLPIGGQGVSGPCAVSMGNPHAVFFVPDAEAVVLETLGPLFERDSIFPKRANIEFAEVLDRSTVRVRVWERGAGVTLACGSGACAVAVAAVRRQLTGRHVTIKMDGGDLDLEWREADGHVYMTGPVAYVFSGEWDFA